MSFKIAQRNDLMNLIYGCIVKQELQNCKSNVLEANERLESLGHRIGMRLTDEFLTKTEAEACRNFKEVAEKVSTAFRLFLGIEARVVQKSETEFSFSFSENPLDENVFLPEQFKGLSYSNLICGLIRGGLEVLNYRVKCVFLADKLWQGRNSVANVQTNYEVNLELVEIIKKKLVNYDE